MWKPVKGYEGVYEISDSGEVRSVDRHVTCSNGAIYKRKGKLLKQSVTIGRGSKDHKCGYSVVNLRMPGHAKVWPVHKLVALAFIPNELGLPTINHKDGNKQNNAVANLEWVSFRDNNVHALKCGLRSPRGNKIAQFTKDGQFVAEYASMMDAERRTGVTHMNISQCLSGRTNSAGGFIWKHESKGATTIPTGSTSEIDTDGSASHPATRQDEDIV